MRQNYYDKVPERNPLDRDQYFTDRMLFYADGNNEATPCAASFSEQCYAVTTEK
jgi:hypothetical protein